MSTSRLLQVINHFREQLIARENEAVQALETAYAGTLRTINTRISQLYQQIEERQQSGDDVPVSWLYEQDRLKHVTEWIAYQVNLYASDAHATTTQLQQHGASLGVEAGKKQLEATVPPGIRWTWATPSVKAIQRMVGATQKGSPLAELFAGFGREAAKAVERALVSGVTLGWNPRKVAPLVERALDVPRWRALTLARTEQIRAFRGASQETFRENGSVARQWRWTCAKSPRSCLACLALDGTLHDLDEEMGSHVCCRCAPLVITAPWSEILDKYGIDSSNIPESRPVDMQTGEDWFNQQSAETQIEILGSKARYDLWRSGVSLKDMVAHHHSDDWGSSVGIKPLRELVS